MRTLTFCKQERLCSQKQIDELFSQGKSFFIFPFKVIWLNTESDANSFQVAISVPKRIFKHASDRNKIKRRIREAYRLNKKILSENSNISNKKCIFMLVYTDKKILKYIQIEHRLKQVLVQLAKENAAAAI